MAKATPPLPSTPPPPRTPPPLPRPNQRRFQISGEAIAILGGYPPPPPEGARWEGGDISIVASPRF